MLGLLGLEFEVVPSDVDEISEGRPAEVVAENALRKARAVAAEAGDALVLGADTDVAIDGAPARQGRRSRRGARAPLAGSPGAPTRCSAVSP